MMTNEELYHHGVLGQRWGVRRYQNKDGSLTAAGRKRAEKLESKYEKVTGRNIKNGQKTTAKKSVREMSDDELRAKVNRLTMEKNYYDMQNQISRLNPKKISAGKKFVNNVGKNIIIPSVNQAGKNLLTKYMNQKGAELLGLSKKDTKAAKKEASEAANDIRKEFTKEFKNANNAYKKAKSKQEPIDVTYEFIEDGRDYVTRYIKERN